MRIIKPSRTVNALRKLTSEKDGDRAQEYDRHGVQVQPGVYGRAEGKQANLAARRDLEQHLNAGDGGQRKVFQPHKPAIWLRLRIRQPHRPIHHNLADQCYQCEHESGCSKKLPECLGRLPCRASCWNR